jgi:hypothetical protein
MGNIVSNVDVPDQTPGISIPAGGVIPAQNQEPPSILPPQPTPAHITAVTSQEIEAVGPKTPQAGYGVDPFGPMEQSQPQQPAIPDISLEPPSIIPDPPTAPPPAPLITQPDQQVSNVLSAVTLLSKMPNIEQMMKDLEKSGCLMPDLQVKVTHRSDNSPLAALQPDRLKDKGAYFEDPNAEPAKPILPEIQLATTSVARPKNAPTEKHELPMFVFIAIIGIIQVIQGAAQVAHFMLTRYPQYEQLIISTQLTTTEVNATVIKAAFIGFIAFITFFTSLTLIIRRVKNHSVMLYVSVALIMLNFVVQNVMAGHEFVSGNPLSLPATLSEIISRR